MYLNRPSEGDSGALQQTPGGGGGAEAEAEAARVDDAVSLIERHFARVDPVQTMALFPPDVPVNKLMAFLGASITHTDARRRNSQVYYIYYINYSRVYRDARAVLCVTAVRFFDRFDWLDWLLEVTDFRSDWWLSCDGLLYCCV